MKQLVKLLVFAAVMRLSYEAQMGSCDRVEEHVLPIPREDGANLFGKVWYARYTLGTKIAEGNFKCMKVKLTVKDGVNIVYHLEDNETFVIRTTAHILSVPSANEIVPGAKHTFTKSVKQAYSYGLKKEEREAFFRVESQIRYPSILYNRSFYLKDGIWAYWECDKLAPKDFTDDHRFILSTSADAEIPNDHEVFNLIQGDKFKFKGEIKKIEHAKRCVNLQFDENQV